MRGWEGGEPKEPGSGGREREVGYMISCVMNPGKGKASRMKESVRGRETILVPGARVQDRCPRSFNVWHVAA